VRILFLEDEEDIAEAVVETLERDRYTVIAVRDAEAAFAAAAEVEVDLAVLDVMVADDDDAGFRLAALLRDADFQGPILFTTARDRIEDRVHGLDLGGDDYLVKPYSLVELSARIRALLRREAHVKRAEATFGPLRIDLSARRVWREGKEVALSDREFAIIELLTLFPQRTFTTTELLERFFPDAGSGAGVVRVYVHQLRTKLGFGTITTVAGGYRLGVA